MKMSQKNRQSGGFIELIVLVVVVFLLWYFLKGNSTVAYFWNSFTGNMNSIQAGQQTDFQMASPQVFFSK